ncbi:hypothetical protein B4144_3174 [Bacillus atrophaeus]|nr:hypothetical protein B4144_3174 [Bacillus atrophaeus]
MLVKNSNKSTHIIASIIIIFMMKSLFIDAPDIKSFHCYVKKINPGLLKKRESRL